MVDFLVIEARQTTCLEINHPKPSGIRLPPSILIRGCCAARPADYTPKRRTPPRLKVPLAAGWRLNAV
jgi:hypothetical protein